MDPYLFIGGLGQPIEPQIHNLRLTASWERGRPARTKPGTASAISPTWMNRERRDGFPSAWPMGFPPTGWLPAASH